MFRASQIVLSAYKKKVQQPTLQQQFEEQVLPKVLHFCKGMDAHKAFIASSIVLAGTLPLSIFLAPTFLAIPFDLAVAVTMPYHMWYGTKLVMEDYVPRVHRQNAIKAWGVLSCIVGYGLVKLSIGGPGIGASVRSLWGKPKAKAKRLD
eukprot:UN00560